MTTTQEKSFAPPLNKQITSSISQFFLFMTIDKSSISKAMPPIMNNNITGKMISVFILSPQGFYFVNNNYTIIFVILLTIRKEKKMRADYTNSGYTIIVGPKLRKPKSKGWYVRVKYSFIEMDGFGCTERDSIADAVKKIRVRLSKDQKPKGIVR